MVTSIVAEHGLQGAGASVAAHGFRGCSSWVLEHSRCTQLLWSTSLLFHGTWDLPGSGVGLVSPASAREFFTTEPPGKT